MTSDESKLYNDLKKDVKKANQRILRIERETGTKGTYATKELYDYLSSYELEAITKKGRISLRAGYNVSQLKAIQKATENFLENQYSKVGNIKKLRADVEKEAGTSIPYDLIDALYQASELYKWANEEFGSKFWKEFAPKVYTMSKMEWVDFCALYLSDMPDSDILLRLKLLYEELKK